jgi:hypothetical protein
MKPKPNYRCRCKCGYEGPVGSEEVGARPFSKPGSWNPCNWVIVCPRCGSESVEEFWEDPDV